MCWLNSDHRRYSQFVAFRVGEILESTDISEWRWLSGKLNVADEATKWQRLPDLTNNSRWFNAPSFLWSAHNGWPVPSFNVEKTTEEIRPNLLHHSESPITEILQPENFSSWKHLVRLTAYVRRFPTNARRKQAGGIPVTGPLTRDEMAQAQRFHVKRAQEMSYGAEIKILMVTISATVKKTLPKQSALFKVCPFMDNDGVMRIHSRIDESDFAGKYTNYPIVLPRDHPVTKLILQEIHQRYHHQCQKTFINEVSRKYYIPRVHVVCWRIRRECQRCKIRSAKPNPPAMGNLPKARLAAYIRPFSYTGVDYFGPMTVVVGRRSEKRWGVLMTCLTTRAIHIEIAHSLSADSCIMALRNCLSRRGTPVQIISYRGTNFIGADKELKKALADLDQNKMVAEFTTPETSWTFNPPASPQMGGCWERLIQSVKKVLAEIRPSRLPTDEVLRNALLEVENIINSRPLTHVPIDHESSPALTPNHFLIGSSNGSKPLVPYDDSTTALRQTWKVSQMIANMFWKRWILDYLPTITRRTKWFLPTKPITVGDIVIIVDPNSPRNCWPKGRVVAVKPSKDGQVCSATVQTTSGLYERPAVKLAVLDVGANLSTRTQGPTTGGDCCAHPSCGNAPSNQSS
ncbi:uncharacterized protein LOC131680191 [Topomyia yanbarensis]|uniref:uncharacterized protein LOC131680191 n=1 Tax=Topomyia yanbarensis TaxID=2498891 RepID=UPI00273C65D6|nr:uncharacterized protein LOC131680191 [Topomyia yanbarensis]